MFKYRHLHNKVKKFKVKEMYKRFKFKIILHEKKLFFREINGKIYYFDFSQKY